MNMTMDNFYLYIGETLDFCQTIEHDIKWIYATMLSGDSDENFDEISLWTLGKVVNELEKLDYSDNDNLLTHHDYDVLRDISDERNYIAHQIFLDFSYKQGYERDQAFQRASGRLFNFHNRMERLWKSVEKIRMDYCK